MSAAEQFSTPLVTTLKGDRAYFEAAARGERPTTEWEVDEQDWANIQAAAQAWLDSSQPGPDTYPPGTVFEHFEVRYVALGDHKFVRYADGPRGVPHIFDTSFGHTWQPSQLKLIFHPDPREVTS